MILQEYWKKGTLPEADAIYFSDGTMMEFNEPDCINYFSFTSGLIIDLESEYGNDGAEIEILGEMHDNLTGNIVYRGAGCMGNEGFISYADCNSNIIWAIFSSFSNPFWEVKFEGEVIVATTELKYEWRIPKDKPECLICTPKNPWDIKRINSKYGLTSKFQ